MVRVEPRRFVATLAVLLAPAVLVLLGACSRDGAPQKRVETALALAKSGPPAAAVVALKAALQDRPDWPEGRFLLGAALLELSDASAASVELLKAVELVHPIEQVAPVLARALVPLRRCKEVLERFAGVQLIVPVATADLQTSLATCHATSGDRAAANKAIAAALAAVDRYPRALLLQARMQAADKQHDKALAAIEQIVAVPAHAADAWLLKAEILAAQGKEATVVVEALREALAAKPDHLPAHVALIGHHLGRAKLEDAAAQLAEARVHKRGNGMLMFLEAQLAYERGDLKPAREITQSLLGGAPDDFRLQLLAGAIDVQAKNFRAAEDMLRRALQTVPASRPAKLLLAQAYTGNGNPGAALQVLAPLLTQRGDVEARLAAGEAHLVAGNAKLAVALFRDAAAKKPNDEEARLKLATAQLMLGQQEQALSSLERVSAASSDARADLVIISTRMTFRDFKGALTAIEALERKLPGSTLPPHLRGVAQLELGNQAEARKCFEQALVRDAHYMASLQYLTAMDLTDGHVKKAVARYEALLAAQPNNQQALLALAAVRARGGGAPDEVAGLLGRAVRAAPLDERTRTRLIDFQLAIKDLPAALTSAQAAVAALPNSAELHDLLGRVLLQTGETDQAMLAFEKLRRLAPRSPVPYMRLADLNMSLKRHDAARASLQQALKLQPDLLAAQRNLLAMHMAQGKLAEAQQIAVTLQRQRPKENVGYLFAGEVALARKDLAGAIALFDKGMKVQATSPLAIKLHATLVQARRDGDAQAVAQAWHRAQPADVSMPIHLGRIAAARKDYAGARENFERATQIEPNNAVAQHLLAWVLVQLKQPQALAAASRAHQMAPDQPAVALTLVSAHALHGQFPRAVELLRQVIAAQPANLDARLELAQMLLQAGNRAAARDEALALLALGDKFARRQEAQELLAKL